MRYILISRSRYRRPYVSFLVPRPNASTPDQTAAICLHRAYIPQDASFVQRLPSSANCGFVTQSKSLSDSHLFAGVDDVATGDLALVHELVHLLKLAEANGLEGDPDQATAEEVDGLCGIGAVAHVAATDVDHAHDSVEDGGGDVGVGGETDADDDTTGSDVLRSLLEGLLLDGDKEGGGGAETVGGSSLDISDKVAGAQEVDVSRGTKTLGELALLGATVDGDGMKTHGLGVLDSKRAETTTSTDDGNGVTRPGTGLLKALVDRDTGAQNGGHLLEVALLGNASDVGSLGNGILLEGTVDGVTGQESVGAEGLIGALAVGAGQARAVDPLDTDVVAELDILHEVATANDNTSTLVATDKGHLGLERPVTHHGVEIGVADTGELDVHQHLIGTGLLDGDLLVDGS